MTIQPQKYMFIRLNEDLELKVKIPVFIAIIFAMTLLTLIDNIFAFFSVPLYFAVIFAAVSEKIEYRYDDLFSREEE